MKTRSTCLLLFTLSLVLLGLFPGCSHTNTKSTFENPILPGFYPDPSICRVGDDYYMVNSTFCHFPGIPIFHSRDLVNWKQMGHVIARPEQMNDLNGHDMSRGIYAPTIQYHIVVFYVACTQVAMGGNFIVKTTDPAGDWSMPYWLPEIDGVDPALFFDDDGTNYIVHNGPAPDNKPLYRGHRALWLKAIDLETMKTYGKHEVLVNGGHNIADEPFWLEGPHLYKKDGHYYLSAPEGGTQENHSQVIFKSDNIWGPWKPNPNNPFLTQRHLDENRPHPITSTGHADLFQTQNGEWYAVFLGCQPYEPLHYNTGRETFMAPVNWDGEWPTVLTHQDGSLKRQYPQPQLPKYKPEGYGPLNGEITITDDFSAPELALTWNFIRVPRGDAWYQLNPQEKTLTLEARPIHITDFDNPSFIGRRQQHANSEAYVTMSFNPTNHTSAGMVIFQNSKHNYSFVKSKQDDHYALQLFKGKELIQTQSLSPEHSEGALDLKIKAQGKDYSFWYKSTESSEWTLFADQVDGLFLSTRTAGGFVGCYFGMYAYSTEKDYTAQATFKNFVYSGTVSYR